MLKFLHLLVSALVIAVPAAGLAQFSDKGKYVEVKKGTRLCSNIAVDGVRGIESASDILEGHERHPCEWHSDSFRARS
jgi:hypothetical protein